MLCISLPVRLLWLHCFCSALTALPFLINSKQYIYRRQTPKALTALTWPLTHHYGSQARCRRPAAVGRTSMAVGTSYADGGRRPYAVGGATRRGTKKYRRHRKQPSVEPVATARRRPSARTAVGTATRWAPGGQRRYVLYSVCADGQAVGLVSPDFGAI